MTEKIKCKVDVIYNKETGRVVLKPDEDCDFEEFTELREIALKNGIEIKKMRNPDDDGDDEND
ncbi:MAG: hypothetical protein ABIA21_00665 [Candidatus Aenigmatarchaeota archaeon]